MGMMKRQYEIDIENAQNLAEDVKPLFSHWVVD